MKQKENCIVTLLGLEVDVSQIKNQKLARVLEQRLDAEMFHFWHSEHDDDHTDRGTRNIYTEHGDYGHEDHRDSHNDTRRWSSSHSESDSHDDYRSGHDGRGYDEHSDRGRKDTHSDRTYDRYF